MRVWIMDAGRWGDSEETRWSVTWWGIPPNDDGEPDIDNAPEHCREFKTERAAMAYAEKAAALPHNYWKLAQVEKNGLEQIEGTTWGWERIGEMVEVAAREPGRATGV